MTSVRSRKGGRGTSQGPRNLLKQGRYRAVAAGPAPRTPEERLWLSQALDGLGRTREAFDAALPVAVGPGATPRARLQLALLRARGRRHTLALRHVQRALREAEGKDRVAALSLQAGIYARLRRHDTAERRAAEALAEASDDEQRSRVLATQSDVRAFAGDLAGAIEPAQEAVEIDPGSAWPHYQLGWVHLTGGAPAEALPHFERAVERLPENVLILTARVEALLALEAWGDAAMALEALLDLSPEADAAPAWRCWLGDCRYEAGERAAALAEYEAAAAGGHRLARSMAEHLRQGDAGRRVLARPVTPVRQRPAWCGPCSLAMVLNAWGDPAAQEDVAPSNSFDGLPITQVAAQARARGFAAESLFGDLPLLRRCLETGLPVITATSRAWGGHYHVVTGYDDARGVLLVQETDGRRPRPWTVESYEREWVRRGDGWMTVVSSGECLPEVGERAAADCHALKIYARFEDETPADAAEDAVAFAAATEPSWFQHPEVAQRVIWSLMHVAPQDRVRGWLAEAAERFPDRSWPLTLRAGLYGRRKETNAAAKEAAAALKRDPTDAWAHLYLARALEDRQPFRALRHARRAVEEEYTDADPHTLLARLLERRGRDEDAAEHYEAAAEFDRQDARPLVHLAALRRRQGQAEEAARLARLAEERAGSGAGAWYALGRLYWHVDAAADARRCLEEALRLDPEHLKARAILGSVLLELGELRQAVVELERAIAREPGEPLHWITLGRIHRKRGDLVAACGALRRAVACPDGPRASWAWQTLGQTLRELGNHAAALECFEQAVALAPEDADAWNDLGIALSRLGRHPEALPPFERAVQLAPEDAWYRVDVGLALRDVGRAEDALEELRRAVALAPDDPDPHAYLGRALARLERWVEARTALEAALRLDPQDGIPARGLQDAWEKTGGLEAWLAAARPRVEAGTAEPWERTLAIAAAEERAEWRDVHRWATRWLAESGEGAELYWPYWFAIAGALELGETAAALRIAREAVARLPEEAALRAYYGLALGYAGDFLAAAREIHRAGPAPRGDRSPGWGAVLFLLVAGDEREARTLARRLAGEDDPESLEAALLELLEGNPHRAALAALGVARRTRPQEILTRESALTITALGYERGGLPDRQLARSLWRELSSGRTALASLARGRLRKQGRESTAYCGMLRAAEKGAACK